MPNLQDNDPTAWMASLINDIQTARCTYRDITGVRYIKPENVDITAPVFWFDDMFDQGSPIMRGIETGNSLADLLFHAMGPQQVDCVPHIRFRLSANVNRNSILTDISTNF